MLRDAWDLALTTDSAPAVGAIERTLLAYLALRKDTGDHLKSALAADPDLVIGLVMKGCFFKLFAKPALETRAREAHQAARTALDRRGGTARERAHVMALGQWCAGDMLGCTATWEAILAADPVDALALRLAHYTHFYIGDSRAMRDSVAQARARWPEDLPASGFVAGMHAFGLEETGDLARAERLGREAVEHNPQDIWATHAVAHAMEASGHARDGIAWLDGQSGHWGAANNFAYHVWWHRALFHLALGEHDAALALYDTRIRADRSDDQLDMSNAASLLWRLETACVAVGARWGELADKAAMRRDDHLLAFADSHFALALAGAGRCDEARDLTASMAAARDGTEAPIIAGIGKAIAEAVIAFAEKRHDDVLAILFARRGEIVRIGGSHAQRDLFMRLLFEAAIRAGRRAEIATLIAERAAPLPWWMARG